MPHPPAELDLTAADVDRLVSTQHPRLRGPLQRVAHGWDNDLFRLGEDLAVRLPRRELAAALVEKEHRWLPDLAPLLPVPIPAPVAVGLPDETFPWRWTIQPWFAGVRALDRSADELDVIADELAEVLLALHVPSPRDAPVHPVRGVPMADRDEAVRSRLAHYPDLLPVWSAGVAAPAWAGPAVWVHGDVHPGNLVLDGDRIAALIDFGDLSSGDPACDLATAWLTFTARGRSRFRGRLGDRYDDATWVRARGWAAGLASLVIDAEDPGFRRMGRHAVAQLDRA